MENQPIVDRVKDLIAPLLEQKGVNLVEISYRQIGRRKILRFLVDKTPGITLDECTVINEEIGAIMDKEDTIAASYVLEVSSPGLDRPIITKRDFDRAIGKKMDVFLKDPLKDKFQYTGTLEGVKEDSISLKVKNGLINIPLGIINKGKLLIEIK